MGPGFPATVCCGFKVQPVPATIALLLALPSEAPCNPRDSQLRAESSMRHLLHLEKTPPRTAGWARLTDRCVCGDLVLHPSKTHPVLSFKKESRDRAAPAVEVP